MRILFLSRWYPYPPDNGSKIRVHGLLRALCEHHAVTLVSFRDPAETPGPVATPAPVDVRTCEYREFRRGSGRAIAGLFGSIPRFLVDTHSAEMERLIATAVRDTRFDLVIASQLSMAAYHQAFGDCRRCSRRWNSALKPGPDTPVVRRPPAPSGDGPSTGATSPACLRFACCTVASEAERRLLAEAAPSYSAVHVVPNAVETDATGDGARVPDSLIFTGSLRFAPNRDAMAWFLADILPAIRTRVPGVQVTITGEPGPDRPAPMPGVTLAGHVPDVRALVARAAVSLAPIRMGGGTRLKILEAMATRTPVVATSKAAEGLEATHGEHLLVADSPAAFADAVCRLLANPLEAGRMADRARRSAVSATTRAVGASLVRLAESVVAA